MDGEAHRLAGHQLNDRTGGATQLGTTVLEAFEAFEAALAHEKKASETIRVIYRLEEELGARGTTAE